MFKAIENSASQGPKFKPVFDIPTLTNIVYVSASIPHALLFQATSMLSSICRISNLLPLTKTHIIADNTYVKVTSMILSLL